MNPRPNLPLEQAFAMEVRGAGVGEAGLHLRQVRGERAEVFGFDAGFGANGFEPAQDRCFRAMQAARGRQRAEAFDAIKPEHRQGLGVELANQRDHAARKLFVNGFGLGREPRKKFTRSQARLQGAALGDEQVGIEGETGRTAMFQHRLAQGIQMRRGGREENERPAQRCGQLGHRAAKRLGKNLHGEDGRDGLGGPRANLGGVGRGEVTKSASQAKGAAQSAGEFCPVEFEGRDLGTGQGNIRAGRRLAAANRDPSLAVVAEDDIMSASAPARAGKGGGHPLGGVEAKPAQCAKPFRAHARLPSLGKSGQARDFFQRAPGIWRHSQQDFCGRATADSPFTLFLDPLESNPYGSTTHPQNGHK